MANKSRGEVELKIAGQEFTIRPTFGALCELEDRTGLSVLQIVASMEGGKVRLKTLAQILWAGMYGYDEKTTMTINDVGELIMKEGLVRVVEQVDEEGISPITQFLLNGVLGGEEVEETEKKPPANQRKKKKKPS